MKTILAILGVVFLVIIAGLAGILLWAGGSGKAEVKRFFDAVATGDTKAVTAILAPQVAADLDEPVLAVWIAALNARLGAYQGLSATDFHARAAVEGGVRQVECEGTARFEKGEAKVRVTSAGGKVIGFSVKSDKLMDWFDRVDGALYRERAKAFIDAAFADREEHAFAMMAPELKAVMPLEKLKERMAAVRERTGTLRAMRFADDAFAREEDVPTLRLTATVEGEKATVPATFKFQFPAMKGALLGFRVGEE